MTAALALLLLSLAAPAPVPSIPDGLRILVVPTEGEDSARVEEVYAGLRAAGLQPVELDERAGVDRTAPPLPARGTLDNARAHLLEARARFHDLDLDAARAAADAAVDEVLRLGQPESALDVMIDALLLKANAALQAGNDSDARSTLTLVKHLDPTRTELHPGLYPPSLCEAYAAAGAADVVPASLVVRARVAGFTVPEVLIDGRAPAATINAGPHIVMVRAAGAVPFARVLVLPAVEPMVLAPFLAPADAVGRRQALVHAARAASDDAARTRALADLASLCAARAVLYVAGPAAALWSSRGLEPLPLVSAADGGALGQATLAALQAPARKASGLPPQSAPDADATVLVVAGVVGLAVAAGAAGLAAYVLLPSSAPPKGPARAVIFICCVAH